MQGVGQLAHLPNLIGHISITPTPIGPNDPILDADGKPCAVCTIFVADLPPQLVVLHCRVHWCHQANPCLISRFQDSNSHFPL